MTAPPNSESSGELRWWQCAARMTHADKQNMRRFNVLGLLWMAAFLGGSFALKRALVPAGVPAIAVAVVPALIGLAAVLAYMRFLRETDELIRKVQLEGAALGFAVGVLFAFTYRLFERAGLPHLDLTDSILPMIFAWAIGQAVAWKRYS